MRPTLSSLADKARETAAGSPTPAGQAPPSPDVEQRPGARERAAMRRRVRKVARLREEQVREIGALLVEMERLGRRNDELLVRKARDVIALDEELNGLRTALGERLTVQQVVATGIAGACRVCGSLLGTEDRFCSRCGTPAADDAPAQAQERPSQAQLQLHTVGAERR